MSDQQQAADQVTGKKIPGFVAKRRIRRFEVPLAEAEGAEPFWFDAAANLTIAETEEWQALLASNPSYGDLWELLTPRITAWNAVALDLATGEYVPVPPPAEIGHDAFRVVDPALTMLMAATIVRGVFGGNDERPKASGSTPAPSSGSD